MKKYFLIAMALFITFTIGCGDTSSWADSQVFVHFIVVPAQAKDGGDLQQALEDFKVMLGQLAGGYTNLGPSDGGALLPGGELEKEDNYSFVVSAPMDITADIEEYVPLHFETEKPYVLVWKAESNF